MIQDYSQFSAAKAYRGEVADRVSRFLPMVRKLAWHLAGSAGPSLDVEDLMQAGLVALTECAQRHEGPSEDGFAAYAKLRVRGAMVDLLRSTSPEVRGAREKRRRIERARRADAPTRRKQGREFSGHARPMQLQFALQSLPMDEPQAARQPQAGKRIRGQRVSLLVAQHLQPRSIVNYLNVLVQSHHNVIQRVARGSDAEGAREIKRGEVDSSENALRKNAHDKGFSADVMEAGENERA